MTRGTTAVGCLACLALLLLWAADAQAYERYKNPSTDAGWCASCHGDFTGPMSPTGSTFPNDDKHAMHRSSSYMGADCDLCHTSGDGRNPWIGSSDGTATNTGYGCVGCHGRLEDGGNDSVSNGYGAGLRRHHYRTGIESCANCHVDSTPGGAMLVGENVKPPYYGTADTAADMPCNTDAVANANENWSLGDFLGLDNDGDLLYDADDPDCATTGCTTDAECDDGEFCNGAETCDTATGECLPGGGVDCDDGVGCTVDSCDETIDACMNVPDDGLCDNGMFCDGVETCNPMLDCQGGTPVDCDDGDVCTDDECDEDVDDCVNVFNPDNGPNCVPEMECFNDVDDDVDGLTDCADPDCDGATGDACDTGLPGICASGVSTCAGGEETCVADNEPGVEGPAGDGTCADGLDNDCDGLTDLDDPDCAEVFERDCFDGLDNDGDGLTDCADPDCEGAQGDGCDTGEPGVCAAGTLTCLNSEETCLADDEGAPEGVDYGNCADGLDNDCDGWTDDADPDCQIVPVEDCFDGEDNDGDGFVDCEDDECEGAEDGPCDTGLFGVCAEGTLVCTGGDAECRQDAQAEPEGDMYDNCRDGLDNDCNGFADGDDPDCTLAGADVWLVKLIAHNQIQLHPGQTKRRRVFAQATGDTMPQPATVTLTAEFDPEALEVMIDPDSLTLEVRPWSPDGDPHDGDDDDDDDGGVTLFKFHPLITCNATGSFTIEWTAQIDAVENRESDGDVLTEYTVVNCRFNNGRNQRPSGDEPQPRNRNSRESVVFKK